MSEPAEVPEWRRLADRARHLISLRRPLDARKLAAKAVALAPGEARAFCVLAIATSDIGQHEAALEHAARAVALEPTLDWPHRVRGYIFIEMQRYEDAVAAGREAVRLAPADPHGLNLLAGALRLADREEEAESAAERLRELAPDWFVTYEVSADIAYQRGRSREAEQWARTGLRIEPGSGRLQVVLGRVLADLARFDEGAGLVQQGLSNEPMDPWHRRSLDMVHEQRSKAHFNAFALVLVFLGMSIFFGIEAVVEWKKQHWPQAAVMGGIAVGALALSLLFVRWLPHGAFSPLRRLRRWQDRPKS